MADFRLAAAAEAQLGEILAERAGTDAGARRRYAALLVGAMRDLADNLRRPALVWHPVAGQRIGVYPVIPSPTRSGPLFDGATDAGHYLVLRAGPDDVVDILGLIPERALDPRALKRVLRAGQVGRRRRWP